MAYQFDGLSGVVTLPLVTKIQNNITLECWVQLPSNPQGCFIRMGTTGLNSFGIGTSTNPSSPYDNVDIGNNLVSVVGTNSLMSFTFIPITLNIYHHIALVIPQQFRINSVPIFYVDGSPITATLVTGYSGAPIGNITIGDDKIYDANNGGLLTFTNATIARVAIYSSPLGANTILTHAKITDDFTYDDAVRRAGAIGYWRLDETSGLIVKDYSNSKLTNNGTISGGVLLGVRGPFFKPNPPAIIHRWRRHV